MELNFLNSKGVVELNYYEKSHDSETITFTVNISHAPFMAKMIISYTKEELLLLDHGLKSMKHFRLKTFTFASINRVLVVTLNMDSSGHINTMVTVSAGSRGYLKFDFDSDQTIIDKIMVTD